MHVTHQHKEVLFHKSWLRLCMSAGTQALETGSACAPAALTRTPWLMSVAESRQGRQWCYGGSYTLSSKCCTNDFECGRSALVSSVCVCFSLRLLAAPCIDSGNRAIAFAYCTSHTALVPCTGIPTEAMLPTAWST